MEYTMYVLVGFIILLSVLLAFLYIKYQEKADEYLSLANKSNFFRKKQVMRPDEYVEYKKIASTTDLNKFIIIPQAPLTMFIDIKNEFRDHQNLYKNLGMKSVDFLIVDRKTLEPVKAIELNGRSHFASGRKNRDAEVTEILKSIGVELEVVV
jgi:hypothetical protein